MPDMLNYLEDGIMPGHWVVPHMPDGIQQELEEAALDIADQIVAEHRKHDRLFDALCDQDSRMWMPLHLPFDRVRVGTRIILSYTASLAQETKGTVTEFIERYGHTEVWTTGGRFDASRWSENSRILVPIPVDLSTLGDHAPPVSRPDWA